MSKATPAPKAPTLPTASALDQLPQEGGSYTRQPDGSLLRNEDAPPATAPTQPAQPNTDTPE